MATTGYILIALKIDERDLVAALGDEYRDYQRRVSMLVPCPHLRAAAQRPPTS